MAINQRIEKLINLLKMNPRSFSEHVGVKESTIRNYLYRDSSPSAESLERIFISIENLNAEWLLSGEGEPFKKEKPEPKAYPTEPPITTIAEPHPGALQLFTNGKEKHHELQAIPLYDITATPTTSSPSFASSLYRLRRIISIPPFI